MNILAQHPVHPNSQDMDARYVTSGPRKELEDKSGSTLPFPLKLFQLLQEAEDYSIDHIVSWLPSNEAFKIHDPDSFVKSVMSMYFKQSKIKSFTRQLVRRYVASVLDKVKYRDPYFIRLTLTFVEQYMYGFTKISQGPNMGGFFHPHFRRNHQTGCMTLVRRNSNEDRRVKGNRPKAIDTLKTSLAKAKASVPGMDSKTIPDASFKRAGPIPQLLFRELQATPAEPPVRPTETSSNNMGTFFPGRRALSLFDDAFGDDFDFDQSIGECCLPPADHISFLKSRALPAPPCSFRLAPPMQFRKPPLTLSNPLRSSHETNIRDSLFNDADLLEPRAIEDMCRDLSNDDLLHLDEMILSGSTN